MRIYLKSCLLHFKVLLEYKTSFLLELFSQVFIVLSYYFIILALFSKFDNLKGFSLYEVLLTFGVIQFGYSINEMFARGIDQFDDLIVDGSFDRLLLRPQPIILQVLCSKIAWARISRAIQALVILIISLVNLDITWNFSRIFTLFLMLVSSIVIFFSIFLTMASYCFLTVKALEVRSLFTDGGKHMAQYPISIYRKSFVLIFTFIIPYAFVNYYPLMYFLGKSDNILYAISPIIVFLYLIPAFLTFKIGMKKYTSTGS